jgi:hypothetical protein
MSSPSSQNSLLEEVKGLLQYAKKPSVWIPSVFLPLLVAGLWAYTSNPQWLEATNNRSARTGKAVTTDPNSPVTTADLDLDPSPANNSPNNLAALLERSSQEPQNQQTKNDDNQPQDFVNQLLQQPTSPNNAEASNPFATAIQDLLNRNLNDTAIASTDPLAFSPILGTTAANSNATVDPLQQALANQQASNATTSNIARANTTTPAQPNLNPALANSTTPGATLPSPSFAGTYAYPTQAGVTSYEAPTPGISANVGARGGGGYVVTPQGTYSPLHQRGTTGYTVTPQGSYIPLPQRGGTSSTVTPQGTYSYPRQRGTTGYTPPQQAIPNAINGTPGTFNNQPFTPNNTFNNSQSGTNNPNTNP